MRTTQSCKGMVLAIPFRDWSHPIEAQLQDQGEDAAGGPGGWRGTPPLDLLAVEQHDGLLEYLVIMRSKTKH